jgi:putative ABC transport system permease protein
VAVIGSDLSDAFFGQMEPLGKEIDVDGHMLKVIGVAEKKGVVFGESQDNFIWIPISTFSKLYGSRRSFSIQAEAATMGVFEAAQDQVRVAMRARRHLTYDKPDDFNIETGESIMELWQNMTRGIYVVTLGGHRDQPDGGRDRGDEHHAGVGHRAHQGDRRQEGARRAPRRHPAPVPGRVGDPLGLRRRDGRAGRGGLLVPARDHPRQHHVGQLHGPVRPWAVAMALGVSSIVGLVAGIYPANRAAALDPVEALRNE